MRESRSNAFTLRARPIDSQHDRGFHSPSSGRWLSMNAFSEAVEMSLRPDVFPGRRTRWLFTHPRAIQSASVDLPMPKRRVASFGRQNSGITSVHRPGATVATVVCAPVCGALACDFMACSGTRPHWHCRKRLDNRRQCLTVKATRRCWRVVPLDVRS